jgi:uncharacterized protein YbjT (DUF2867 family)
VKGEMEQGLIRMGFTRLVIARPSIIDGDRAALGQTHRLGEDIALRVMKALAWLIPLAFAPITGATIAHAMRVRIAADGERVEIQRSGQMQQLSTTP